MPSSRGVWLLTIRIESIQAVFGVVESLVNALVAAETT